jgi:hypothetical protein
MLGNGRRGITIRAMPRMSSPDSNGRSAAVYGRSGRSPRNEKPHWHVRCSIGCGNWVVPSPTRSAKRGVQGSNAGSVRFVQQRPSAAETPQSPVDWRKSITRHTITCLECGVVLKQLTGRHLRGHGLDARSYRAKYGIPQRQPLAARETAAKQKQMGPGT